MSSTFSRALQRLAGRPEHELDAPWGWPGHGGSMLTVRDAYYQALERELAAGARAGSPPTVAGRALLAGDGALGDLFGLLLQADDADLWKRPEPGSSALGQILGHVLAVEERYRRHIEYARDRSEDAPVRFDPPTGVAADPNQGPDRILDWIDLIQDERRLAWDLARIPDSALRRPSVWMGHGVDIQFRLHRSTAHIAEHAVEVEKVLVELGRRASEPERIVRLVFAARGAHAALSAPEELQRLDAELPVD